MKIMQVMPEFALAGAEVMCENLIYGLKKIGADVVVVSLYDYHSPITDRLEQNGVKVVYLNKKSGFDFSMYRKLRKTIKSEKPDVIHTHRYVMEYVIPASLFTKIPAKTHTVHNIASCEVGKGLRALHKIFFKMFKVVPVALTELIQSSIVEEYKINVENVPVVFNGMSVDKYYKKSDYSLVKNILHIGRFSLQKNHKGLIAAFEIIHKKHPEIKLNLAGVGELEDEIKRLVKEKELDAVVCFKGLLDDVKEEMSKADIFCLPSNYEGMPMTIIEAMASGLPVVATAVGGVPDMITDGKDGVLCKNTPEDIADALEKVIESAELRETLGKNAVDTSKEYSSENMAKKYYEIYCNCPKK